VDVPREIPTHVAELLLDSMREPTRSSHLADELAEPVLAEVGRIALSATALEDVAYTVCRSVKPRHGPFDDFPIGARIDEALDDLASECPEGPDRTRAEAWLAEAKAALGERNAVHHSVPVAGFGDAAGVAPMLDHFPKDKNRPMVRTPLTLDALTPIARRLKAAREGWIAVAVAPYPSSPLHGGTPAKPPTEWR
jgi:hypothetical protein